MSNNRIRAKAAVHYFRARGQLPHRLAKDVQGRLYEFISYPFVHDSHARIMVRYPGDPTTLEERDCHDLFPEDRECYCTAARQLLGRDEFYMQPRAPRKHNG